MLQKNRKKRKQNTFRRESKLRPIRATCFPCGKPPGLCFRQAAAMLDQALQTQVEGLLHIPPSPGFFVRLNPGRLLAVVRLFLGAVGHSPRAANEPVSPLLTRSQSCGMHIYMGCDWLAGQASGVRWACIAWISKH